MYIEGRLTTLRPPQTSDHQKLVEWAYQAASADMLARRAADLLFTKDAGKPSALLRNSSLFAVECEDELVGYAGMFDDSPQRQDALFDVYLAVSLPTSLRLEVWGLLLTYSFGRFPIQTARRRVLACDEYELDVSRAIGFAHDGVERQAHWLIDRLHDMALLSMTRDEWLIRLRILGDIVGLQLTYESLGSSKQR